MQLLPRGKTTGLVVTTADGGGVTRTLLKTADDRIRLQTAGKAAWYDLSSTDTGA